MPCEVTPIYAKDIHTGDTERKEEHKKELERGKGRRKAKIDSRGGDRESRGLGGPVKYTTQEPGFSQTSKCPLWSVPKCLAAIVFL